jgi:hypothetical protein
MFLCVTGRFLDRERGVGTFSDADAHATLSVPDNDRSGKTEAPAAGNDARDAPKKYGPLIKLRTLPFSASGASARPPFSASSLTSPATPTAGAASATPVASWADAYALG